MGSNDNNPTNGDLPLGNPLKNAILAAFDLAKLGTDWALLDYSTDRRRSPASPVGGIET